MGHATYILTFKPTPTTTVGVGRTRSLYTAIPSMTSLKDGDCQHSSALAQSSNAITIPSKINPKPDSQKVEKRRSLLVVLCNTGLRLVPITTLPNIKLYSYALQVVWSCSRLHSGYERFVKLCDLSHIITIKI